MFSLSHDIRTYNVDYTSLLIIRCWLYVPLVWDTMSSLIIQWIAPPPAWSYDPLVYNVDDTFSLCDIYTMLITHSPCLMTYDDVGYTFLSSEIRCWSYVPLVDNIVDHTLPSSYVSLVYNVEHTVPCVWHTMLMIQRFVPLVWVKYSFVNMTPGSVP